ncbi:hypothetical protein BJ508DRAFT_326703 [Ascobolus immersus RN42]|uniref:Uncharacterized protein n=1 Tax=Ascobolus immersus RN42 TaxID=1160509 RepID=A0A3N4I4S2_ASCIM|nr:hypothetical protein BJ508DRAFT_326703 [Ascobolus immersus RN42]
MSFADDYSAAEAELLARKAEVEAISQMLDSPAVQRLRDLSNDSTVSLGDANRGILQEAENRKSVLSSALLVVESNMAVLQGHHAHFASLIDLVKEGNLKEIRALVREEDGEPTLENLEFKRQEMHSILKKVKDGLEGIKENTHALLEQLKRVSDERFLEDVRQHPHLQGYIDANIGRLVMPTNRESETVADVSDLLGELLGSVTGDSSGHALRNEGSGSGSGGFGDIFRRIREMMLSLKQKGRKDNQQSQ